MKKWMTQADAPKEVNTVKKMNDQSKRHTTLKNGRQQVAR